MCLRFWDTLNVAFIMSGYLFWAHMQPLKKFLETFPFSGLNTLPRSGNWSFQWWVNGISWAPPRCLTLGWCWQQWKEKKQVWHDVLPSWMLRVSWRGCFRLHGVALIKSSDPQVSAQSKDFSTTEAWTHPCHIVVAHRMNKWIKVAALFLVSHENSPAGI